MYHDTLLTAGKLLPNAVRDFAGLRTARRGAQGSLAAAIIIFMLVVRAGSSTASDFTICNRNTEKLHLAYVVESSSLYPILERWNATGWIDIPSGCKTLVSGGGRVYIFLTIGFVGPGGASRIAHYELNSVTEPEDGTPIPIERFFCVRDMHFDRELPTLDGHTHCPEEYYLQLFNVYVQLPVGKDYTLTIN